MMPIEYSTPIENLRNFYHCVHMKYYSELKLHQIHIYHNDHNDLDLSEVKDEDILYIYISEPYAEKWISDWSKSSPDNEYIHKNSCITWYDGRWGDPYENPSILNRTSLTLHINVIEYNSSKKFSLQHVFFKTLYPPSDEETIWYPTLEEACQKYRDAWNNKEQADSFTEITMKHVIHLWNLYHDTNYHLIENGRYYDY